jgi:NTP pyrophosphatase (non-canonical NTP hydrolase)
MDLNELKQSLREFAGERDWEQFHSPKNLSMALIAEAGELVEHFQWLTEDQSSISDQGKLAEIAEEIADIQIYLIRLADRLNIDINAAVFDKIEKNKQKYPSEQVRGSAKKYTEYE